MIGKLKRIFGLRKAAIPESTYVMVADIPVQVIRKSIRSLRLVVMPPQGAVRLSVPTRLAQRDILEFLKEKLPWIRRQKERISLQSVFSIHTADPGEKAAYRSQLKVLIPPLIAYWEPRLGVKVAQWGIRAMRTRWGTCNPRLAKLSFSLALAKQPPECLEYIVVHEMLHLLESGHGTRYKTLMNRHFPQWKACRAKLNGKTL